MLGGAAVVTCVGAGGAFAFLIALVPKRGREFVLDRVEAVLSGIDGEEELESRCCCCCLATNCSGMLPLLFPPCRTNLCSLSSSSDSSESNTFPPVDRREDDAVEERLEP